MNKKEILRVERTVAKWQTIMDLGYMTIANYFSDEEAEQSAEIVTSWEYRQAAIIWYSENIRGIEQDELDQIAIHELGHIVVAPMSDYLPEEHRKLEEFVVEGIAKAILNSRNK